MFVNTFKDCWSTEIIGTLGPKVVGLESIHCNLGGARAIYNGINRTNYMSFLGRLSSFGSHYFCTECNSNP